MSGVCGLVHPDRDRPCDAAALRRMADALRHRGRDGEAFFEGPGVGLGFRRLDLPGRVTPAGPAVAAAGSIVAVIDGELLNGPELRVSLAERGVSCSTDCDAGVVAAAYEHHGRDFVDHLRGVFAIAVWDDRSGTLTLARDRFGIKPVCHARARDGTIVFACEPRGVLASGLVEPRMDPAGLADVLGFGGTVFGRTMFEGVRDVEPGEVVEFRDGRSSARRYWDFDLGRKDHGRSMGSWAEELRERLRESVRLHVRLGGGPVVSWLSPGIDSSAVTALAAEAMGGPLPCLSLAFDEARYDELRRTPTLDRYGVAGLEPEVIRFPADAVAAIPSSVWFQQKPVEVTLGIWTIARGTAGRYRVALTGQGADSMFAGGSLHAVDRALAWHSRLVPRPIRRAGFPRAVFGGSAPVTHEGLTMRHEMNAARYAGLLAIAHSRVGVRLLVPELAARVREALDGDFGFREPEGYRSWTRQARLTYVEAKTRGFGYLNHCIERGTMAHGIEARSPFLDHPLVELTWGMPGRIKRQRGREKAVLREAMRGVLPPEVAERRKFGLDTPYADVRRPSLDDLRADLLSDRSIREKGYLDPAAVRSFFEGSKRSSRFAPRARMLAFTLQLWDEMHIRGRGAPGTVGAGDAG